jgi:hypothetical protein
MRNYLFMRRLVLIFLLCATFLFVVSPEIYPPFGTTAQDGHWRFGSRRDGIAIWGADVTAFLDAAFHEASTPR